MLPLPLRAHDYLLMSRAMLLDAIRPLTPEQYTRRFEIGPGALDRILTHLLVAEWYYAQRMLRADVPPYDQWEVKDETLLTFAEAEAGLAAQAKRTRAAIERAPDWDATFDYRVTDDEGRKLIVTTSIADLFTQLVLHEVHHRAQALNILRQLGVKAPDLDFNALMMPRRQATD